MIKNSTATALENFFSSKWGKSSQWRWISRFDEPTSLQLPHPRHARWMKKHQEIHSHREIAVCLFGNHMYGFRKKIWKLSPGTVLLIDKGDPHDAVYSPYHADSCDLWIHLSSASFFTINSVLIAAQKRQRRETFGFFLLTHARPFAETVALAWDHCAEHPRSPLHLEQLKAAVTAMLLEILLYSTPRSPSPVTNAHQHSVVKEIAAHIKAHPEEDFSLHALASMAGYDPVYFHRLFSRFIGESPHKFITRNRIQSAKEMLAAGEKTASIAAELGFSSASYFCRFFKRETRTTPYEWVTRNKEGSDFSKGT